MIYDFFILLGIGIAGMILGVYLVDTYRKE